MSAWNRRAWQLVRAHPVRTWLLLLALVAVPMFYLAVPAHRECPVTEEKCAQIKEGMTREEVRAVFEVPPGDYTDGESSDWGSGRFSMKPEFCDTWKGPDCCVYVIYDPDSGLVDLISIRGLNRLPKPTIFGWVRLLLRDWFEPGSR